MSFLQMLLTPILRFHHRKFWNLITQKRNVRPNVKICRERFQLSLDVRQFKKDELRVKAAPEYVVIEGRHEKRTDKGLILRQFYKKFKLPEGCDPQTVESKLSDDGMLTVIAPRIACGRGLPCEKLVGIKFAGPTKDKNENEPTLDIKDMKNDKKKDPCK